MNATTYEMVLKDTMPRYAMKLTLIARPLQPLCSLFFVLPVL